MPLQILLPFLLYVVTPVMLRQCQLPFNNKPQIEVFKQNGTKNIIFVHTDAVLSKDRFNVDYIQVYKNGTPVLKFDKGKIGKNENLESSLFNTTFFNSDICEKFEFEAKFFEEATHCEKDSISKEYDPANFFDLESVPEYEVEFIDNVTSVKVFSHTNLVSDDDFLACISKSSLSYFGDEFHQSEKGIFEFKIPDVRNCDNFSVEVDFTLHGNKRTKSFDLNICPYIRPLWHKVLLYSVVGVVGMAIMLTVVVLVYRKMEERQFLDVVVDYGVMEDTQDVKYLQ